MFVVNLINGLSDELTKRTIADLTVWLTVRLTIRPKLADLTIRLTTRLTIQSWQFGLQFGFIIQL